MLMPMKSETSDDVKNVEAWAEVIRDVLWLMPIERRAEVLALVTENEEAERKERTGRITATPYSFGLKDTPGLRHWDTIMRLKSLVVQVFVRSISNNHSPKEAAEILFAPHPHGSGSRVLEDYLRRLPKRALVESQTEDRNHVLLSELPIPTFAFAFDSAPEPGAAPEGEKP
jgi:hypothetical protein